MALFQKEEKPVRPEETRPSTHTAAASSPPPRQAGVEFQATLGKGARIEGRLAFDGSVRIDGQVEGEVNAQETVFVGESAVLDAQVHGNTVILLGQVNGDVTARKRVELRSPAKLVGNLSTPALVIHEGATFEGHCVMGSTETHSEKTDKKIAIFPQEERNAKKADRPPAVVRASSEAAL